MHISDVILLPGVFDLDLKHSSLQDNIEYFMSIQASD